MHRRWQSLLVQLTLLLTAVLILIPFLSVALASVSPAGGLVSGLSVPDEIHLENFATAWTDSGFSQLVMASVLIAGVVVPVTVLFATLAGYGLGMLELPGGRRLYWFLLLGLTLPFEAIVIPLYFDLKAAGLTNSYLGIILVEVAAFMPFGAFWMRSHFATMPRALFEAAVVDGASTWTILLRIILPLSRPAITTLAVLIFMWSWKQFLLVLILIQDPSKRTAPAALGFFVGEHAQDIPLLSAATIIVILPIAIVFVIFQRSFIDGMLHGAIKG